MKCHADNIVQAYVVDREAGYRKEEVHAGLKTTGIVIVLLINIITSVTVTDTVCLGS